MAVMMLSARSVEREYSGRRGELSQRDSKAASACMPERGGAAMEMAEPEGARRD